MVNLLHLCEMMTTKWLDENDLIVPYNCLEKFAQRNHFLIKRKVSGDRRRIRLIRKEIPCYFISGKEQTEFRFMDIADTHIGHPNFNEKALREKLEQAVTNGINQVFIAGDLFEGYLPSNPNSFYSQVNQAFSIFKDYPLTYYAINGNHDYSFEQYGLPNPVKHLSNMLKNENIDFNYFDEYLMDFVICGVIKRVMHVERQDFNKKRIFAILKLKSFDNNGMLSRVIDNVEYPVRFFQVGHIHINVQMYYSKRKVFISQSGSFIGNSKSEERANIIQGKVIDEKVFMN